MILHLCFGEIPCLTSVSYTSQPWWFFVWSNVFFQVRHHGLRWKFVCKVRRNEAMGASTVEHHELNPSNSSTCKKFSFLFFTLSLESWWIPYQATWETNESTNIQLESLHLIHTINHPKTDKFQTDFLCCAVWGVTKEKSPQWPSAHFDIQHMETVEVFACSKSGGRNFAGFQWDHVVLSRIFVP